MKVLLVEPPKKTWELMGECVSPPLGLAQLAAVLEEEGIEVGIIDCNAAGLGWAGLEQAIGELRPDVVGATALTPFFSQAVRTMAVAKGVCPQVVTCLGGPHVTFLPEETLRQHPEVDVVVRGEGERTLVELLRCLERGQEPGDVSGLALRRDGDVVLTPTRGPIDVNDLPSPAYHLLPMERYHFTVFGKFATVLSSRGCPYRCTFCSEWRFWNGCWRPRKVESVVDEIELLHREYGRECFWFGDDCFNVDAGHIRGICEEILSRGLDISWYYQGRADFIIEHRELLPLMRRAGNLMAQVGVETATNRELARFNKRLSREQVEEAVALLKRNDIVAQGLLLVGTREDDAASIAHKLRYMKWLDPDFPIFTMFTPFPGSDIYEQARASGWLETLDYSLYDMSHAIMSTEHLSREQLTSLYNWCFISYYTDPIKVARGLLSRNAWKRRVWRHMVHYTATQFLRSVRR
ncbi:MAG: radical SAM protein [Chloroflexota bacterium]|nr:radical SAM protein [Chloroflexota bacterium]